MLAQHFVLGVFAGPLADLKSDFGSLLKELLFLGRTLLLRLWVLGTHVRMRLGRLLQGVGWWKRLGRLGKHVRRLGRLGRHVRTRLGRLLQGVGWWKRLGRLGKHVRRLGRLKRLVRRRLLGW